MANAVVPAAAVPARAVLGSRSVARSSSASAPTPLPRRPGGIQVFVDPAGETAGAGNTWGELETRRARVKENVRETRTLGGTTVRGTGVKGAVCARIPVFRDPVGESAAGTRDEVGGAWPWGTGADVCLEEGVLRLVPGSGSEMEALRKDPLKNYPGGGDG
ncbi:hypothetical protein C0993_001595 [Termitomyces sp. T159_Od127]|nr:hypothetical protein C0993_001595 [Termitomyces sp. T159_Od127]